MSNGYFLADTNSLVYAYRAGGPKLQDEYMNVADAQKRELAVTKTVLLEIEDGPLEKELLEYIADREITVLSAPETELKLRTGQITSKNAGEVSMLEMAALENAAGPQRTQLVGW